jgi:type II secretory ATPase GspE/PulE/Tfp pilus assembly ATPase PilB-like protein
MNTDYFDNAQSVREGCSMTYKTEYALRAAIIAALAAQVAVTNNDVFTTTVSVSGYPAQDVQNNMAALREDGFTATLSGTTLTMAW